MKSEFYSESLSGGSVDLMIMLGIIMINTTIVFFCLLLDKKIRKYNTKHVLKKRK